MPKGRELQSAEPITNKAGDRHHQNTMNERKSEDEVT